MSLKIVTWNVNSIKMRLQHLIEFIESNDPDIICLQELKCETDKFPSNELSHLPYNLYIHGQKTYNGVAILSKIPADEIKNNFDKNPIPLIEPPQWDRGQQFEEPQQLQEEQDPQS